MEQFLLCGLTLQGSCDLQLERPLPLKKILSQGWGSWKQETGCCVFKNGAEDGNILEWLLKE